MSSHWTAAFCVTSATFFCLWLVYWAKCNSLKRVMRGLSEHMESIYSHIDWCHQSLDKHLFTYEKMKNSETQSMVETSRLASMVRYLQEDNDALIAELIKRDEADGEPDWS